MNQPQQDADVLIIGAGLVGGALACALAEAQPSLSIKVIDAGGEPAPFNPEQFDPRVVALTHASRELLDSFGAWPLIEAERLCPYQHMTVWDGDGTAEIDFDCFDVQQSSLGHIVENSVAVRAIMHRLRQYPQVELIAQAQVETYHRDEAALLSQVILADGRVFSAPLVLACDGANSRLRQLANLATREWNYGHSAIVTTVRTEKSHQFTAWQRFMSSGPLAFLPLQHAEHGGVFCSIVWSQSPDLAEYHMGLDDDAFCAALTDAFESRLGRVVAADRRFSFPLRQRHAVDYVQPGLALLGDAAHTIHPLAGQGVNLGFQDVVAMRDEISRAVERQLPLADPSLLQRYQRARKAENLKMMAAMEGFKRLFGADNLALRWLRNEGMRQVNRMGPVKNQLIRQAMGL